MCYARSDERGIIKRQNMKDFSHITKFENILNTYGENLQELNKALNEIKELIPKYQS